MTTCRALPTSHCARLRRIGRAGQTNGRSSTRWDFTGRTSRGTSRRPITICTRSTQSSSRRIVRWLICGSTELIICGWCQHRVAKPRALNPDSHLGRIPKKNQKKREEAAGPFTFVILPVADWCVCAGVTSGGPPAGVPSVAMYGADMAPFLSVSRASSTHRLSSWRPRAQSTTPFLSCPKNPPFRTLPDYADRGSCFLGRNPSNGLKFKLLVMDCCVCLCGPTISRPVPPPNQMIYVMRPRHCAQLTKWSLGTTFLRAIGRTRTPTLERSGPMEPSLPPRRPTTVRNFDMYYLEAFYYYYSCCFQTRAGPRTPPPHACMPPPRRLTCPTSRVS